MKTICEICKKIISEDPKFIDLDKLEVGMKLKSWYETDYEPTHGKFSQRGGFNLIRKIDGDLIFHSFHGHNTVEINTRGYFK